MSRSFPLRVAGSGARGPKKRSGPRYPNGRLKPDGPNPRLLELRRLIAPDVRLAENPLDAAFANGWLSEAEHRAGRVYARLCAQVDLGGPRAGRARLTERAAPAEGQGRKLAEMSLPELAALWDAALGDGAPAGPEERAAAAERAMAAWRAIGASVRAPARAELFSVCVLESWPQWLLHRLSGLALRRRAEAENRPLADDELALIALRFTTRWETKRDLLVEALAGVAAVLRPPEPRRWAVPSPNLPIAPTTLESADYVTPAGDLLFQVERRGRRTGPKA